MCHPWVTLGSTWVTQGDAADVFIESTVTGLMRSCHIQFVWRRKGTPVRAARLEKGKAQETTKGGRLLDSHRPCVLSATCSRYRQDLKVKVNKPLGKPIPPLLIFGFKTIISFSGRSCDKSFAYVLGVGKRDGEWAALMILSSLP